MTRRVAPYGTWSSPLDITALFERQASPAYPDMYRGERYWLETKAKEGGRLALMRKAADGRLACLTPTGFNVRTRVHEYGGRCFVIGNDRVYFSNFSDQRLYVQALREDARPRPLTPKRQADGSTGMYADLQLSADGRWLIFVWESDCPDRENRNALGYLALPGDGESVPGLLVDGCDFYANPVLAPDGRRLAWIQWRHPYMPWDQTELWLADLGHRNRGLTLIEPRMIAGGERRSICQLVFGQEGTLYFAMDGDMAEAPAGAFWNLYQYRHGAVSALTADRAEYGQPHWVFGESRCVPLSGRRLLAVRTSGDGDELVLVDVASRSVKPIRSAYQGYAHLSRAGERDDVLMVARSARHAGRIVRCRDGSESLEVCDDLKPLLSECDISVGRAISYPTRDGAIAHAYFYAPNNACFIGPDTARPPLLVMVHGGPTSRCAPSFDPAKQYWTTIGFAVLDVNHRGSTGYGRAYRQSLLGHWGEYESIDIVDGIEYLIRQDLIDQQRVCIRGRSAGGYTVLRALTGFPQYFAAAACYFGIGNLVTLAETTHKFERHYTDNLIGEEFDPQHARRVTSLYYQRSPIHFVDRIGSPTIIFQGVEDKVVPMSVSRELVIELQRRGIDHEYTEYPGEGHGFRSSQTNIDALTREVKFYVRVMGLDH